MSENLRSGDDAEINKWIAETGLGRVARIVAVLSNSKGLRGRTERPDIVLLWHVARLMNLDPDRSLHSAAEEIAIKFSAHRIPRIEPQSLTRKLEKDFRLKSDAYRQFAREHEEEKIGKIEADLGAVTPWMDRILARIIANLPTSMDLYDQALAEAKNANSPHLSLLESLDKKTVYALFEAVLRVEKCVLQPMPPGFVARSIYEAIVPQLDKIAAEILASGNSRPTVRRKGGN